MAEQGASLREQLEENYDTIVAPALDTPAPVVDDTTPAPVTPEPVAAKTPEPAADTRTAEERARDAAGKFVKPGDKAAVKPAPKPGVRPAPVVEKLGVRRPDSWKKELWPIWDKLDEGHPLTRDERKLFMEYLPERESQYLKGVSTYKAEADNARELNETVARYQDIINEAGMRPAEFVSNLADAHQTLSRGNPEQRLDFFAKLMHDYEIPVHQMFVQGQDGKVYLNKRFQRQQQHEQPQHQGGPVDIKRAVQDAMDGERATRDFHEFVNATDKDGNKLYPHYETVRQTMNGLLQSRLSSDLKSAYAAAIRLPQHSEIYDAMQKDASAATEAAKQKEEAERVARARANNASVRSSAPTGSSSAPAGGKGIRASLENAYDEHVAGRV